MAKDWSHNALALAGVFQATALVDQIARTGYVPSDAYLCSINSLLQQNPESVEAVYGNLSGLEMGLQIMTTLLSNKADKEHPNTMRYVMSILHLQNKVRKNNSMLSNMGERLEQAARQAEHFDNVVHDNVVGNLADIYTDTVSTFKFRIQVSGDANYLQQTRIANQIRALLFAAIRSATLWRQVDGSRLDILIQRKRLLKSGEALMEQIKHQQLH